MTKAFDKTLEIISDLEYVVSLIRTEMTISDSQKNVDLQKIISLLDQASNSVVDTVVLFQKHERVQ